MTLPEGPLDGALVERHVRPQFQRVFKESKGVYLANHSLGRPPDATATNVARGLDDWYRLLDDCWTDESWMGEADKFSSLVGGLVGLPKGGAVVPKTSAGQGLRAVLNAFPQNQPVNVVATTGEFDSIDFILKAYAEVGRANVEWVGPGRTEAGVPLYGPFSADANLVVVSAVFFTTGQVMPGLAEVVGEARKNGALVLVDAYHAVGVMPFDMAALDADFVIGGCYKYLRGGPGACYLAIHPRHLDRGDFRSLDTGWFAKKDVFSYDRPARPEYAPGGDGWLESTPPVLTAYQATPGLGFTVAVGVERIRAYNLQIQAELRGALADAGVSVHTPANPNEFGAFVLVPHLDAARLADRLKAEGVTVDARGGFVRLGPDLFTTADDIARAVDVLKNLT